MKTNINLRSIKQLLSKNKYVVEMNAKTPTFIQLSFPSIIHSEFSDKESNVKYEIQKNKIIINNKEEVVANATIRAFIFSDIIKRCFSVLYNPILVKFKIQNRASNEIKFFNYLDIKLSEEEQQAEEKLKNLMVDYFVDDNEDESILIKKSLELGISDGFHRIISYLSKD